MIYVGIDLDIMQNKYLKFANLRQFVSRGGFGDGDNHVQGIPKSEMTNNELAFTNFCYSIANACFYLTGPDADGKIKKYTDIKNKDIQEAYVFQFLQSLAREIKSWISDEKETTATITIPEKQIYLDVLGNYYANVIDVILAMNGLAFKNTQSTIWKRNDVGFFEGTYIIEKINKNSQVEPFDVSKIVNSLLDKEQAIQDNALLV